MRHAIDTRDNPFGNSPEPTELEEKVLGLLETEGFDTAVCDQILKLISTEETRLALQRVEGGE